MEKIEALLGFLREEGNEDLTLEDIEESIYDDCSFEVNPRSVRYGTSPRELKENAERVRFVLDLILGHCIKTESLKSSNITEKFYRVIDKHLKSVLFVEDKEKDLLYPILYKNLTGSDTPPEVPEGKHDNNRAKVYQDIVNFIFRLYHDGDYERDQKYTTACRQAFDGEKVKEYRDLSQTNDGEYLVLTDDEADEKARDYSESYIDDCMDIPDHLEVYFDRERFIEDAISIDGRGHIIASYDGCEHWFDEYYIYRIN